MTCKYFLVPQEILDQWQSDLRTRHRNDPLAANTERADRDVREVLSSRSKGDFEKAAMLEDRMTGLLASRRQETVEPRRVRPWSVDAKEPSRGEASGETAGKPVIDMAVIPRSYRDRASSILHYWENSGRLSWDGKHQLVLDGRVVPGSNIHDLLIDASSRRKAASPPVGFEQMVSASRSANIPASLFGNPRWLAGREGPEIHSETPVAREVPKVSSQPSGIKTPASAKKRKKPGTSRGVKGNREETPVKWDSLR